MAASVVFSKLKNRLNQEVSKHNKLASASSQGVSKEENITMGLYKSLGKIDKNDKQQLLNKIDARFDELTKPNSVTRRALLAEAKPNLSAEKMAKRQFLQDLNTVATVIITLRNNKRTDGNLVNDRYLAEVLKMCYSKLDIENRNKALTSALWVGGSEAGPAFEEYLHDLIALAVVLPRNTNMFGQRDLSDSATKFLQDVAKLTKDWNAASGRVPDVAIQAFDWGCFGNPGAAASRNISAYPSFSILLTNMRIQQWITANALNSDQQESLYLGLGGVRQLDENTGRLDRVGGQYNVAGVSSPNKALPRVVEHLKLLQGEIKKSQTPEVADAQQGLVILNLLGLFESERIYNPIRRELDILNCSPAMREHVAINGSVGMAVLVWYLICNEKNLSTLNSHPLVLNEESDLVKQFEEWLTKVIKALNVTMAAVASDRSNSDAIQKAVGTISSILHPFKVKRVVAAWRQMLDQISGDFNQGSGRLTAFSREDSFEITNAKLIIP